MSGGGTPLATAFVEVRADASRIPQDVRDGMRGLGQEGRRAGQDLGGGIRQGAAPGTRGLSDDIQGAAERGATEGGRRGGSGFALRFRQNVGSNMSGFGAAFTGLLPVAGVAAVGAVMGAQLVAAFGKAVDLDVVNSRLAAQLDISKDEAGKYGKLAGDLYKQNYGDSIEGLQDTVSTVMRNMAGQFSGSADPALQQTIKYAEDLSSTFDIDVNESTRAAAQLMKGGLAGSASEAFDIITAGFQKIPNASEDLLDTFNEYGVQFEKLGLSGQDAVGLISQAMQGGARNTDLAADALKEFSIRAIDGSSTSATAYQAIGLNAQKMSEKIAKGGKSARDGFGEVLTALKGIEDPVKRNAAAVGLFGTQAEDLGSALYGLDLSSAAGQIDSVTGAAGRMDEALGDTAQARIAEFKRTVEVGMTNAAGAALKALDGLADGAETLGGSVRSYFTGGEGAGVAAVVLDQIRASASGLADQFGPTLDAARAFGDTVTTAFHDVVDAVTEFYQSENIGDYFTAAQAVIGAVVAWIQANVVPFLAENLPQVISIVGDAFTLVAAVIGVALDLIGFVIGNTVTVATYLWQHFGDSIITIMQGAWTIVSGVIGGALDIIQGIFRLAIDILTGNWSDLGTDLQQVGRGAMDAVEAIFRGSLDVIKGLFSAAVDAIGVIWDGIKEAAKLPVRFVVETVLNNGLIDGINTITKAIGADSLNIPHIPLPKGFSAGGYTGDGGKHEPMGVVHGGEWVVPKEQTQALRRSAPGFLESLNNLPGYTNGGLVALGKWFQSKGADVSENSAFGGTTPGAHVGKGHAGDYAIDVNKGAGTSASEQAFFDSVVDQVRAWGYKVLWRVPGHFNHLHAETQNAKGGGMVGESGGFLSGLLDGVSDLNPLTFLTGKVNDALSKMPAAGVLGDVLKAAAKYPINAVADKIKDTAGSVLSFFTGEDDSKNGGVKDIVRAAAKGRGWDTGSEWDALQKLVQKESSFDPTAQNPTSTAYGLFQFLNGTWAGVGGRKTSDPALQSKYGLDYIAGRYGDPLAALAFHNKHNYYAGGTPSAVGGLSWVGESGPELVDFRGGERVFNANISRRMEAAAVAGNSGGPLVGTVNFGGESSNRSSEFEAFHHRLKLIDRGGVFKGRGYRG